MSKNRLGDCTDLMKRTTSLNKTDLPLKVVTPRYRRGLALDYSLEKIDLKIDQKIEQCALRIGNHFI